MSLNDENKKHTHSEIEKRRRDKMNQYITELSRIIPMCSGVTQKLDKLTVIRMAVEHAKLIKENMNVLSSGSQLRPSFISDDVLLDLILQNSEGFLFVVSCDRGKIYFVSESVYQILNYKQSELLGQNWFDILHPKDIAKVKEQLSCFNLSPKERFIDTKTMLPLKAGLSSYFQTFTCSGARRSFFCRMKLKSMLTVKDELNNTNGSAKSRVSQNWKRKYCVIHCVGYLKSWMSSRLNINKIDLENDSFLSCLVALCRPISQFSKPNLYISKISQPMDFTSRHAIDGKFLFVDQRATLFLGYLPQELLGTSCYEYCHPDDLKILMDSHLQGSQSQSYFKSSKYRFKTKSDSYIYLQTSWKTFKNPWTKELEFFVAIHSCLPNFDSNQNSSTFKPVASTSSSDEPFSNETISVTIDKILSNINEDLNSNDNNKSNNSDGEVKNMSKNLASSRLTCCEIGKYIADEVFANQHKNKEPLGSFYPLSFVSNYVSSSTSDSFCETDTNVKQGQIGINQLSLIDTDCEQRLWTPSATDSNSGSNVDSMSNLNVNYKTLSSHTLDPTTEALIDFIKPVTNSAETFVDTTQQPLAKVEPFETPYNSNNTSYDSILSNVQSLNCSTCNLNPVGTNYCTQADGEIFNKVNSKDTSFNNQDSNQARTGAPSAVLNEEKSEAALSKIMSTLEADAELDDYFDFMGFPWSCV